MITTEREALLHRIVNLYWTLSRHYKELNQGEYSHIPFNENTEYFHECRNVLLDEFADFEGNEAPEIIDAVLNPRQTTIKEIRDLDQLLVETLEYLGMPVNIPTVEELLRPRGHLVENADSWRVWEIEKGEDHWLLTSEGLLECHGGGWLKNADGYILDPYGQKIGSNGIESGLDNIINHGESSENIKSRDTIIEMMLDSRFNYHVPEERDETLRKNWYWNLADNLNRPVMGLSQEKSELFELFGRQEHQFIWPVKNPTVTSAYGERPKFFIDYEYNENTGKLEKKFSKPHHDGIDIIGERSISSIEEGYVYKILSDSIFGKNVFIYHGGNISSRYCHLDSIKVKEQQLVSKGESIGKMGKSGLSTGIHLHFEMRKGFNNYLDPGSVLDTSYAKYNHEKIKLSNGSFKNIME